MKRKRVWMLLPIAILVAGIIAGVYLNFGRIIHLESCAVEIDGEQFNSSQPLAELFDIWEHEVESISLSGNLEVAIFTGSNGFSLLTAEQGKVDVDDLTQIFLLNNTESANGAIIFNCADGDSYCTKIRGNGNYIGIRKQGGGL